MTEASADIDATHVLVLGAVERADRAALKSCHTAVVAGLNHATAVDVFLDPDQISAVSLGPLAAIAESDAFELVADGQYRGTMPDCVGPLAQLLDVSDWEDIGAIERIVLRSEAVPVVTYRPADRHVAVDDARTDGAAATIRDEIEEFPAGLLETKPLVRWRHDGHEYTITPPSVTVDGTAFPLSNLASVATDRDARRVRLAWEATDRGFLSRLADHFGPSRPTTMTFDDSATFERVAQELEGLGETLGVLTETRQHRP